MMGVDWYRGTKRVGAYDRSICNAAFVESSRDRKSFRVVGAGSSRDYLSIRDLSKDAYRPSALGLILLRERDRIGDVDDIILNRRSIFTVMVDAYFFIATLSVLEKAGRDANTSALYLIDRVTRLSTSFLVSEDYPSNGNSINT